MLGVELAPEEPLDALAALGERAERVPEELGFEPRLDRPHHPFP